MGALRPPAPDDDPRQILAWVRRLEVIGGIAAIPIALALWNDGPWRWVLLAMGLISLSPWPGAAAILRRAERHSDVLVSDPERRRARARRIAIWQVPISLLLGAITGYLLDGWPAALFLGLVSGAVATAVSWWMLRR
jgi:Kef-type K+ transport system membrane component KefB